jgi:hypothetical protein
MKVRAKIEFSVIEGDFEQRFDVVMTDDILPERPLGMAMLFVDYAQNRLYDVVAKGVSARVPEKDVLTVADALYPYLDVSQETKENDEVIEECAGNTE